MLAQFLLKSPTLCKDTNLASLAKHLQAQCNHILHRTRLFREKFGIQANTKGGSPGISICRQAMGSGKPCHTKSSSPNKRKSNAMGTFEYGTYIRRSIEEAIACDLKNGNTLWWDAIVKEVKALMDMGMLKILGRGQATKIWNDKEWQFAPVWMIFDKKQSGQMEAWLVIGGHVVDASGHDVYASTMKTISAQALMLIALANKMPVLTRDIGNAYLYASTKLKVYC